MTTKEMFEQHGGEWMRWAVPMVFAAGMGWTLLKSVPALQEKVQSHDTRIAVIETKLDNIGGGINDLKSMMRRRNP